MAEVTKVRRRKTKVKPVDEDLNGELTKLVLPTEVNEPPVELTDSIITIYGRKGVGKTSLASSFPNALTFMFERTRRNLRILQVQIEEYTQFLEYLELFLQSDDHQVGVIDTVDQSYEYCMDYICSSKGINHPNEANDYGQTWRQIKLEIREVFGRIQEAGKGLIFLSHENPKPLNTISKKLQREDEEAHSMFERMQPSCSKGAFEVIEEICDYVFYYGFIEGKRAITVRSPSEVYWTSCGMSDQFLDPDGNPVNTFLVGDTPEEAYKTLLDAHGNKVRDIRYEPPRENRRRRTKK